MFGGISYLQTNPFYYFSWVLTVVISITLHELAHGWMAIRRGDDTPIRMNRMTGNPFVHMGPFSLIALFLVGIAWGQMPIDQSRMRGKYAEAAVAFAGPAINLLLAVVGLVGLALYVRFASMPDESIFTFGHVFSLANLMLFVFNLFPVPPLDGSRILANFHRPFAMFISDPEKQQYMFFAFIFVFMAARVVMRPVTDVYDFAFNLIAGIQVF